MRRININLWVLIIMQLILFMNLKAQGTKKASLQKEYSLLLTEIKSLQKTIDVRKRERNISLKEVELINEKITRRKRLISNIENQMKGIIVELSEKEKDVENINEEIVVLKAEYAKLILWLSKNHSSTNKLAFVLESKSFTEAYQRIRYIKKFGDYRVRQSIYLKNQIERIMGRINSLNQVKKEKRNLLDANMHQQKELFGEKKNRDSMVTVLSSELQTLKKKVDAKNKQASIINSRIKNIIEQEILRQREILLAKVRKRKKDEAAKTNTKVNESDIKYTTDDIEKSPEGILSNSFQASRGSMPWPVASGIIVSKYGRQPHPADATIFVDNNGIDIKSPDNSEVRSIYKGTVVRIFEMPTYNICMMVRHGDFFTVYSYLKATNVKVGDVIEAKQVIGKCGYSEQHGHSLVNLQIWHYQNKQNPESWLRGR